MLSSFFFLSAYNQKNSENQHGSSFLGINFQQETEFSEFSDSSHSFNIQYIFKTIEEKSDPNMCKNPGQLIDWSYGTFKCNSSDIISSQQLDSLKNTTSHVAADLNTKITSKESISSITLSSFEDFNLGASQTIKNADLVIVVGSRPLPPNLPATVVFDYQKSSKLGRPLIGGIYINPNFIPEQEQFNYSQNNSFYGLILHVTYHILGIHRSLFSKWINPSTKLPYGDSFPLLNFTQDNHIFTLLTTPYAKAFAESFFNNTVYSSEYPSGIEIEPYELGNESLSHPKSRLFYTDFMSPTSYLLPYNTDSFLGDILLCDTGFYSFCPYSEKINVSWIEKHRLLMKQKWGIEKQPANFPTLPPQNFPEGYFCSLEEINSDSKVCTFDFLAIAKCNPGSQIQCPNSDYYINSTYCQSPQFYNPNNYNISGTDPLLDYAFGKSIVNMCSYQTINDSKKGEVCVKSSLDKKNVVSPNAECLKYQCSAHGMYIIIGKQEKFCSKKGTKIQFAGYKGEAICPDPMIVCGEKFVWTGKIEATIILTGFLVLFIIVFWIGVCIYCKRQNRVKTHEATSEMSMSIVTH